MPPSQARSTGSSSRIFCLIHKAIMPTIVAINVASSIGMNTSVGLAAPAWRRYIMMDMGMRHNPDALSTRNIIIASEARVLSGLIDCSSCIAFSPIGVAALSRPSILADTFMKIDPIAGCPLGMPGNRREKSGLIRRPKKLITPPLSPIFINPIQRASTPVSPSEISNAVEAEENEADIISDHTCMSPAKTVFPTATMNAIAKKAIQI